MTPVPPAEDGVVLAAVKHAARRLRRWPSAMLDRGCARRLAQTRPGRRNGPAQPNRETPLAAQQTAQGSVPRVAGGSLPDVAGHIDAVSIGDKAAAQAADVQEWVPV